MKLFFTKQSNALRLVIGTSICVTFVAISVLAADFVDPMILQNIQITGLNNTPPTITTGSNDQIKLGGLGVATDASYGGSNSGMVDLNTTNADGSGSYANILVILGRTLFGGSVGIIASATNAPGYSASWSHSYTAPIYAMDINGLLNATNILVKYLTIPFNGSDGLVFLKYLTPTPNGTPAEYPVCVQNADAIPYSAGDVRTCPTTTGPTVVSVDVSTTGPTTLAGPGSTGQIEYSVANADGCQALGAGPGWSAPTSFVNGSASYGGAFNIEQTTTFTLLCYNNSGSIDVDSVTIIVN